MKKIKNIEKVYEISNEWIPGDTAFIKEIKWTNEKLTLLTLSQSRKHQNQWPDRSKKFIEISMTFKKVSNLKLHFGGIGMHQVTGFDIIDVSANGLNDINFQIEDYENGTIGFNCKDASVDSVKLVSSVVN